jgi:hypothetical protein
MSRRRARPVHLVQIDAKLRVKGTVSLEAYNQGTERQVIVCMRVADGQPEVPSQQGSCDGCLARVWLAPSTMNLLPQLRAPEVICLQCCLERVRQQEG